MNEVALGIAGAVATLSLSAVGSAIGCGMAASSSIGAWKKCYAQNKPAPFILLSYVGVAITQTLYGMILMFTMISKVKGMAEGGSALPGTGLALLILGIFSGLAIGMSAVFQGRAAGVSAVAQGETGMGFTNNLAALGVIETAAIFTMVFTLLAVLGL